MFLDTASKLFKRVTLKELAFSEQILFHIPKKKFKNYNEDFSEAEFLHTFKSRIHKLLTNIQNIFPLKIQRPNLSNNSSAQL